MGLIFFPTWSFPKTGEIWKRPKDKLNLICNKVKLSPDFGRRPFQSFSAIFHFRNLIAHAYTISLNGSFTGEPPNTTTEIERKANPKYAKMYHTDTEKIIRGIHKIYDPNDNPFFTIGDADWLG